MIKAASQDLRKIVALSLVKNMGPVSFKNLREKFGSVDGIFRAERQSWGPVKKDMRVLWEDVRAADLFSRADDEIAKALKSKIDIISMDDPRYPLLLGEIYAPPILLYVKGILPPTESMKVGVVGSRVCSLYGRRMATQIAAELVQAGIVVVSGLALGIDTAAHQGALESCGITVAVLGGGINKMYPKENKKLAEKIAETGALVSEYPVDMVPESGFFPVRNRIISGLCQAVLVVEAKEKSGALITADMALEQGREVFALPGNADSSKSMGTNSLLKQGAHLVLSAQDVLAGLGYSVQKKIKETRRAVLTAQEESVYSLLESGPVQLEDLVEEAGISLQKLATVLSYLEMKGMVKQTAGKNFQKA